jgi:hypothetical protein
MLAWNQATGNNVQVPNGASPGYNINMGWAPGAQNDIFVEGSGSSSASTDSTTGNAATGNTTTGNAATGTGNTSTSSGKASTGSCSSN